MPRLDWNAVGERFFEGGVDRGVFYVNQSFGVEWTGLISVVENPSGGEPTSYYIDGEKYLTVPTAEEYEATITAFNYPASNFEGEKDLFLPGFFFTQQPRETFGFSYRTKVGNDVGGIENAYKVHVVYNAFAFPAQRTYKTLDSSSDPSLFSWRVTASKMKFTTAFFSTFSTSHLVVDSRNTDPATLAAFEAVIYGDDLNTSRMPTMDDFTTQFGLITP